jgi:hypothetical protein
MDRQRDGRPLHRDIGAIGVEVRTELGLQDLEEVGACHLLSIRSLLVSEMADNLPCKERW